jgi:retron-type reverse transcriptase
METYTDLYSTLCSYENLYLAWRKARKRKTLKDYVIEFESDLDGNLKRLQHELETFTYSPNPLTTFVIRDPKTRRISASHFRDRVVHHALCNIIEPILSKNFIYDSFANQKGKGTHLAIMRFEQFLRKIRVQNAVLRGGGQHKLFHKEFSYGYALKADVRHYFDTVDHETLLKIIEHKIKDKNTLWLIKTILKNHKTEIAGKGMPIGNLTSQFFANVYLNELDQFIKHQLMVKCYLRYVDDFVILHRNRRILEKWKVAIDIFLRDILKIELHPDKTRIINLENGMTLLGFRVFYYYRLLKKSNAKRILKRLERFRQLYNNGRMKREDVIQSFEGWFAYAEFANTYNFRRKITKEFSDLLSESSIQPSPLRAAIV